MQDLKSALDRNSRALAEWRSFNVSFQAAHPELPDLQFSSDFRVAFVKKNRSNSFPFAEAETVELSAEERRRAESLHQETLEAKRLLDQAQKSWRDCEALSRLTCWVLASTELPPNAVTINLLDMLSSVPLWEVRLRQLVQRIRPASVSRVCSRRRVPFWSKNSGGIAVILQ